MPLPEADRNGIMVTITIEVRARNYFRHELLALGTTAVGHNLHYPSLRHPAGGDLLIEEPEGDRLDIRRQFAQVGIERGKKPAGE